MMTSRVFPLAMLLAVGAGAALSAQAQWQDVIRNLRHPKPEVRLEAVEKLGEAAYVPGIEPVAPLIGDPDDRVQSAALEAELTFFVTERLGSIRVLSMGSSKSRAQQAFDAGPLIRTATIAPTVLVDQLIAAMRDENARVRFDAIHALGFIADTPLSQTQERGLIDGLDHYDPVMRAATARVLGRMHLRVAGDKLIDALSDSNGIVREFAIESVGRVREDRALTALRDYVVKAGNRNVDLLMLAVARIGSPDDRDLFRQRLSDRNPVTRRAAIEGLGRIGDRESIEPIAQLMKTDKSEEVKLAAAFGLQLLGQVQTHVIASAMLLEDQRMQAQEYLFELGRASVPGIESALKVAVDSRHRSDLLQSVGYLGNVDDIGIVEPFLKDKDDRVIRAATNATLRLKRRGQ